MGMSRKFTSRSGLSPNPMMPGHEPASSVAPSTTSEQFQAAGQGTEQTTNNGPTKMNPEKEEDETHAVFSTVTAHIMGGSVASLDDKALKDALNDIIQEIGPRLQEGIARALFVLDLLEGRPEDGAPVMLESLDSNADGRLDSNETGLTFT